MTEFNFKKRYGQNFLQNKDIIDRIVKSIKPSTNDLIIEIGPGSGALTTELIKYNANLIAFEIDKGTYNYLSKLENEKSKIIYEDFLKTDVKKFLSTIKYNNIYIIGNLPYYITTPIIEKIINLNLKEKSLTIMVQKEVGERFLAKPHSKEYGYITVILNYWYNIEKIVDVNRENFYPVPNVDSVVIKLTKKESLKIDYNKFVQITKESFQFKRKNILNNLKNYNKEILNNILNKHGRNITDRAEDLDLETFIDLSNLL